MGYRLRWPKKNLTHCPGWVDHYKDWRYGYEKLLRLGELHKAEIDRYGE